MISFLYENYPYGSAEAFVEYEMRELASYMERECAVYSFCPTCVGQKRFVPENAHVINISEGKTWPIYVRAFLSLFSIESLREIMSLLKEKHDEGFFRCFWRIYRYQLEAAAFITHYKKVRNKGEKDIFVSYWLNQCAYALVKLKRKYSEITIVSRGHGYDVYKERGYLPFRRQVLSGMDKIYLINHNAKEYFAKNYGEWLDMSKVAVAHLGVSMPQAPTAAPKQGTFRVVTCASIIPLKRLDLMIDALTLLGDADIEWVHFGDGPLAEKMQEYAREKLADTSIRFSFMGKKSLSEIQAYYATTPIHLFVNSSDTEGTPVSVMEAMSYGIPAIGRDVGGIGELIDATCGCLIDSVADPEKLAKAIKDFYLMPSEIYIQKREAAFEKVYSAFNADRVYREYIEEICKL